MSEENVQVQEASTGNAPGENTGQAVSPPPAGGGAPATAAKRPKLWAYLLLTLLISTACSVASVAIYHRYFARDIIAVNVVDFLNDQKNALINGTLTEQQVNENIAKMVRRLQAIPPKYAVISADVAVRNIGIVNVTERGNPQEQ